MVGMEWDEREEEKGEEEERVGTYVMNLKGNSIKDKMIVPVSGVARDFLFNSPPSTAHFNIFLSFVRHERNIQTQIKPH
jgi:hypothetical protein